MLYCSISEIAAVLVAATFVLSVKTKVTPVWLIAIGAVAGAAGGV